MIRHILIATDGSALAGKAVAVGSGLARGLGARLTCLTVTMPLASLGRVGTAYASMPQEVRRKALDYLEADARAALRSAHDAALAAGIESEAATVEHDHPHEAIIAVAEARGADLIVVASHGRSGVEKVLLGSVAQKLMTHSAIPVLVCR